MPHPELDVEHLSVVNGSSWSSNTSIDGFQMDNLLPKKELNHSEKTPKKQTHKQYWREGSLLQWSLMRPNAQ